MLSDGLVLLLVMLLCMPIAVECVCPFCFGGLPSCSYDTNKKCPCDTTITENIALVAAVSSATAIAGGKFFKMPGVLAHKYLRMFTSASLAALLRLCLKSTAGTDFELLATTTVAEAMQAIRNGQITAADVIVGFGGFIDEAADEAAERKLAAKAKTIAEARDAGLLGVGLSSNADQCGPWLFLWVKVSNFVMVRTTALSSVMVETGEGKPPSTVTVKVAAFKSEFEFFEALTGLHFASGSMSLTLWPAAMVGSQELPVLRRWCWGIWGLVVSLNNLGFGKNNLVPTVTVSFDALEAGDTVEGCCLCYPPTHCVSLVRSDRT